MPSPPSIDSRIVYGQVDIPEYRSIIETQRRSFIYSLSPFQRDSSDNSNGAVVVNVTRVNRE